MVKRVLYVFLVLIFTSRLSFGACVRKSEPAVFTINNSRFYAPAVAVELGDTLKVKKQKQDAEDKKKIKELAKAKRQAKPEKLGVPPPDTLANKIKVKPPRQRRPEGLERPPEMPRRNN
jgi:hypothetical protein